MTTTRNIMLAIAREAINNRATQDGYAPGEYDPVSDDEGYIISIINALQHWCHEHGMDWHAELARSQELFGQDVAESQPDAVPLPPPEIEDLRCPKCGQNTCFVIEVSERLLMFSDGVVLHGDTGEEWGDWSYCRCHSCGHRGTVYQFRACKQSIKEDTSHG